MKTKKAKEPKQENPWGDRLARMKQHQREHSKNWARNKTLLYGDQQNEFDGRGVDASWKTLSTLAYGWGMCEALQASIFSQNPSGVVDPYDKQKTPAAALLTAIMRFDFDQMNTRDLVTLAITDTFITGYSVVIETCESDKRWIRYPANAVGEMPEPEPAEADDEGATEALVDQRWVARRVHPKDWLVDPQATLLDLSDARYCAVAFYPTIAQLRSDPTFASLPEGIENYPECHSGTRDSKLDGTTTTSGQRTAVYENEEQDPNFRQICVWEIHDKLNHELVYVTDYGHNVIGKGTWPARFQIGGRELYAITLLAMHPDTESIYPKAEIDLIANQLSILNRIDAFVYEDSLTKWRKYVAPADLISPDTAAKVTDSALGNDLILVDPDTLDNLLGQEKGSVDLRRLIVTLDDVAPKRDLFAVREVVISEIHAIAGYGPLDRGGMPKTRSAREAVAIKEQLGARMEPRRAAIERFFQDFGCKHLMFLQQRMDVPRYVKLFPDVAKELATFIKYDKEEIEGNFEYRVLSDTSTPQTSESRKASEMQLFQAIAPILQATGGDVIPAFRRLAVAFQWEDVDSLFQNHKAMLQNLAALLVSFKTGSVKPEQLLEAAAQAVQSGLTPAEIKNIAATLSGGAPPGQGSAPRPAGQRGDPNALGTSAGTM